MAAEETFMSLGQPVCSHCTLSLPPENIKNPDGFLIFSGNRERVHWKQWVNNNRPVCL